MSGISLGTGLISGLDYQSLIDQLLEIEARPRDMLLQRMGTIDAQRTAYLDISARITALLGHFESLSRPATFNAMRATSSLPDLLSASAGSATPTGSYSFIVRSLASTYQAVSRGFHSRSAPLTPGTITIESAQARINGDTPLSTLNGHAGVQRGALKITDAAGQSATIQTSDLLTLGEVVERINGAGIGAQAAIRGDGLVLTDTSGGSGALRVQELAGGQAAASLGFGEGNRHDSDGDGELAGRSVMYLTADSPLAALNDGLGLRTSLAGGDFSVKVGGRRVDVDLGSTIKPETRLARLNHGQGVRLGRVRVTSVDGTFAEVDLSGARTVADVTAALHGAFADGRIRVTLTGQGLIVSDSTPTGDAAAALQIEDVHGHAAQDLGIAGSANSARITGSAVLHMDTLGDVLAAINAATGNEDEDKQPLMTASLRDDGLGLVLESRVPGPMVIEVPADGTSRALEDLGFAPGVVPDVAGGAAVTGARIVGGLNTTLLKTLNGGRGFELGVVRLSASGGTVDVDLAGAATLAEVVQRMQAASDEAALGLELGYDATGTRMTISDRDGGPGTITVADVTGDFAAAAGLARSAVSIRGDNLQRRYVHETTRLAELNAGRGVTPGKFRITDSRGMTADIDLSFRSDATMQDVIREIDSAGIGVTARINDTGDGLLIVDTAGGSEPLAIEERGGTFARDLNVLGTGADGVIDGSFELAFEVGGGDTLDTLTSRINSATSLVSAAVLNDGTAGAPYRLSLTARHSGAAGALLIDSGDSGLGISTLTQAQDARVLYGGDAAGGILLTSADNTFDDVVDGLSFTVSGVSEAPVHVTVDRNLDGLVEQLGKLVEAYNQARQRIAEAGDYDPETQKAGVLLGEGTLRMIDDRMYRAFTRAHAGAGGDLDRLSDVGFTFSSGGKLAFDETKFRAAYAADPEAVTRFFTADDVGAAHVIRDELERITESQGLIERRTGTLADNKELLRDRVDYMNQLLENKRQRLLRQFQAMESALAMMQSQQTALANLASLAAATGTSAK